MTPEERTRLRAIVAVEFHKHRWDTFADEPPSMAQGGRGVVVPGCSMCKVRLQTVSQFTDHLCEKVQAAVEREFTGVLRRFVVLVMSILNGRDPEAPETALREILTFAPDGEASSVEKAKKTMYVK